MPILKKIDSVQKSLQEQHWDGWLLYDFRKTNDLTCRFIELLENSLCTRRFFYWIPSNGTPVKIVHRIESHVLAHLPGEAIQYSSWQELESALKNTLQNAKKIAMEYSPHNAIPVVSKVDAGTLEMIRSFGIEVVSSANILQQYTSVWTDQQLQLHIAAGQVIEKTVEKAWKFIHQALAQGCSISEYHVQQFILEEFAKENCITSDPPICATNAHSSNPHYAPEKNASATIKKGDFILIDLWCKKNTAHAVYADVTRVGVAASKATSRQQMIFDLVKKARNASMDLLHQRLDKSMPIMGWEVDQACRDVIAQAGYGPYFTHRTGHNIGEKDHGDGANIDNYETKDNRQLIPGTCFSIEPGIYLPNEFGVRLEHDVYLEKNGKGLIVTGLQEDLMFLF